MILTAHGFRPSLMAKKEANIDPNLDNFTSKVFGSIPSKLQIITPNILSSKVPLSDMLKTFD